MAQPQGRTAVTASVSSPIGGWNARDSIAEMPPLDAVILNNLYPTPTDVQLRLGYTKACTGIVDSLNNPLPVNTLMNYAGTGTQDLFAAAGTKIWDVSGTTAIASHTISNDKMQTVQITTAGGHFLVACNGQDATTFYDGTSWTNIAPTGTAIQVNSITHVGTLATATTATANSLVTGNSITISGVKPSAYNGTFKITVLNATQFTYVMATTPATNATANGTAYAISSITSNGNGATVTTASAHNLFTGNTITVTGASPADYNGTFYITKVNATSFTYVMASVPATNATTAGTYSLAVATIISAGYSDTLASITTNSPHGLITGNQVTVSGFTPSNFNGTFIVTVLNTTQFTYEMATVPVVIATTLGSYVVTTQTMSSIVKTGIVATLTTPVKHDLVSGNVVTISGATPSQYNGTYYVVVLSDYTFGYVMASIPVSNATVTGTYATYQGSYSINFVITGVNSNKFVSVNLFKNRLYFTEENSMRVWYLPVNSLAGEALQLDFGGIARNGGFVQAMGTWTLDAGQGADDYAVFVTNMGEIIVYNGTDPNDAATWALKGVWQLGYIFARRCFFKWSGDLLLLTQDGLVPLASALQSSRLDPRVNLTDKIYYAISQAATLYSINFGWQIAYYASENMLIINVPFNTGTQQFVMNTISKSWANFTGINAQCWELSNDQIYFGGTGYVGHFWNAYSDDSNNINAEVQQAYSYFDARGQLKRFTMIRPIFQTDNGIPSVLAGINVDFATQNDLGSVSFNAQNAAIGSWDNAIWDTSIWGGALSITKSWQGVTGIGYSGGVVMKIASQGIDVHWASTDYVMERGGIL